MIVKDIIYEDFVNYKAPSMFVVFPRCSWKCGIGNCHNYKLKDSANIEIDINKIVRNYIYNPITSAIVFGGLEPFDSYEDMLELIAHIRSKTQDAIVIYTGYEKNELSNEVEALKKYPNIIIKYGRYLPSLATKYDELLGITLASNNQYSEVLS